MALFTKFKAAGREAVYQIGRVAIDWGSVTMPDHDRRETGRPFRVAMKARRVSAGLDPRHALNPPPGRKLTEVHVLVSSHDEHKAVAHGRQKPSDSLQGRGF